MPSKTKKLKLVTYSRGPEAISKKFVVNPECENLENTDEIPPVFKSQCFNDQEEGQYVFAKYAGVTRVLTMNVNGFITMCQQIKPAQNPELFMAFLNRTESDVLCLQNIPMNVDSIPGWDYLAKHRTDVPQLTSCVTDAIFSKVPLISPKTVLIGDKCVVQFATVTLDGITSMIVNINARLEPTRTILSDIQDTIQKEQRIRHVTSILCCGRLGPLGSLGNMFKFGKSQQVTDLVTGTTQNYTLLNTNSEWTMINNQTLQNAISSQFAVYADLVPTVNLSSQTTQLAIQKIKFEQTIGINQYRHKLIGKSKSDKYNNSTVEISTDLLKSNDSEYPIWWASDNIKLPISDIKLYDYHSTTQQMEAEFSGINPKRMQELTKLAKRLSGAPIILSRELAVAPTGLRDNLEMDIDEIMLYYLKTRKDLRTIVMWPATGWDRDKDRLRNTFQMLNANGLIFYTKRFILNYNEACALMFALYATTHINKTFHEIEKNTQLKGWNRARPKEKRPILVFFYEYTSGTQVQIAGNQAPFKMQLRNIWKLDKIRMYDILYISDFYSEALDNCHMFLNKNSMKLLSLQNISRFCKLMNHKLYTMINTLKSVIYTQFDAIDMNRFSIVNSFGLFVIGLRRPSDIDVHIIGNFMECSSKFQSKFIEYLTIDGKSYIPYIDRLMSGTPDFKEKLENRANKSALIFGASDYREIIINPRYHQYYCGIKMPIVPYDLVKRIYLFRPKSLSDLISVERILKYRIRFPCIPDKIDMYYRDNINPGYIKKTIKNYLTQIHGIRLSIEEINSYFTKYDSTRDVNIIDLPRDRYIFFKICGFLLNYYDDFKHLIPDSANAAGILT